MKKSKWLALAGVAVLSVGILAACSSKSSTSGTTYGYVYSSDPETLDYITSNTGPTTTAVTNGVDGLMETDNMVILYLQWLKIGLSLKMV